MTRLSLASLATARIRRPQYDPASLRCGVVHFGVGAFHRAHQAVFTDDALEAAGGDWGILGVSLRRADAARALRPQDGLYTLELRSARPSYRIIGCLRRTLAAPQEGERALAAFAARTIHVATLTVTEAAYRLDAAGALDLSHPDVRSDLDGSSAPRTVAAWLTDGLWRRASSGGGPITILSCDNLRRNGDVLGAAVLALAERRRPGLGAWISANAAFPNTVVDAITPASDEALSVRIAAASGLEDQAGVQREPFSQWVMEDRFLGPRPAWERAGVLLVPSVQSHESLKLHVLNAAHSALAYLGPPRGHALVREAVRDPELGAFLDAMMLEETALALKGLEVARTWRTVRERLAEPALAHRLDQIARDGAVKLKERIHPLILSLARSGRPPRRLAAVVKAWMRSENRSPEESLSDPALFAPPFRDDPALRRLMLDPST